jgi:hypothetical protein
LREIDIKPSFDSLSKPHFHTEYFTADTEVIAEFDTFRRNWLCQEKKFIVRRYPPHDQGAVKIEIDVMSKVSKSKEGKERGYIDGKGSLVKNAEKE